MSVLAWVMIVAAGLTSLVALVALAAVLWTLLRNQADGRDE